MSHRGHLLAEQRADESLPPLRVHRGASFVIAHVVETTRGSVLRLNGKLGENLRVSLRRMSKTAGVGHALRTGAARFEAKALPRQRLARHNSESDLRSCDDGVRPVSCVGPGQFVRRQHVGAIQVKAPRRCLEL